MNEDIIWKYLKQQGLSDAGAAGLMGNLNAESSLRPNNLQDTYNQSLGMSDVEYTQAVDNGTYTGFINDSAGYGLAQWTWHTRKKNLLNFAKSKNKSIGDLSMQLDFLINELSQSFSSLLKTLKETTSVKEASDAVLYKFEAPANASSKSTQRYNMSMVYYNRFAKGENTMSTYTKGQKKQLSKYFVSTEFDCHGNGCCSTTEINPNLVERLNQIREHFNAPITISSGYRCPTHNRNVSGATGSRHTKGDAADIIVKGHTPREVAQYAESIGIKGIGLYETASDGHFVHIDVRDAKSFWYGQACAARTTFGGTATGTSTSTKTYMSIGDSGDNVKQLQKLLNSIGYSLGEDGIYGGATQKAVIDFQSKNGLAADGMAGQKTMDAIYSKTNGTAAKTTITVNANLLNVRQGPGIQYAIVDRISKGATYQLLETSNGWGRIDKGWVSMQYVS